MATLNRVLLPRLGCPEAEGILGGILAKDASGRRLLGQLLSKARTAGIAASLKFTISG